MSGIETVKQIKEQYIKALAESTEYTDVLKELLDKNEEMPITAFRELNAEGLPSFNNKERQMQELLLDLTALNGGAVELAHRIDSLIYEVDKCVKVAPPQEVLLRVPWLGLVPMEEVCPKALAECVYAKDQGRA